MALTLVTPPTVEPLSIAEAKVQCRASPDVHDEDGLIARHIATARERVEAHTHRALLTQTWALKMDGFECPDYMQDGELWLPLPPVASVTSIVYLDTAGVSQTWSASNYRTDLPTGPMARRARITPAYGVNWPATYPVTNAVTVTFVSGYGASGSSVPASLISALALVVAHLYHQREPVAVGVGIGAIEVPLTVEALLWPYKAL